MTEQNDFTNARNEIQQLLDWIESEDWVIVDYDPQIDPYEPIQVTATIRHDSDNDPDGDETSRLEQQHTRIKAVLNAIENNSGQENDGAKLGDVVADCKNQDIEEDLIRSEIESLRQRGEIYEPVHGRLRTTR